MARQRRRRALVTNGPQSTSEPLAQQRERYRFCGRGPAAANFDDQLMLRSVGWAFNMYWRLQIEPFGPFECT